MELSGSPNITSSHMLIYGSDKGSNTERYLLLSWCSFVLLGCFTGNSIILLAAVRCNTIRLDRISLVLIKNIALSDIAMGIFGVHPTLASLVQGTWPYGPLLCNFFHFMQIPVYKSGVLLICGFHLSKLHLIVYPLRSVTRTRRSGHVIIAVVWVLSTVVSVTQLAIDKHGVVYDYRTYRCIFLSSADLWKKMSPVFGAVFVGFPTVLVGVTTATMISVVRRVDGRLNKQGITVALYLGCLYLVANLPFFLYLSVINNISHQMSPRVKFMFEFYVHRTSYFLMFINCFCNFFVYFQSVKSFKSFVKRAFLYVCYKRQTRMEMIRLRIVNRFS